MGSTDRQADGLCGAQPAIEIQHAIIGVPVGGEKDGGRSDFVYSSKAFQGN